MGNSPPLVVRRLLRGLVVAALWWLSLFRSSDAAGVATALMTTPPALEENVVKQHQQTINIDRQNAADGLPKWDLNYLSKRRVPNGPDPIHNRRAGNSRRPPGQT